MEKGCEKNERRNVFKGIDLSPCARTSVGNMGVEKFNVIIIVSSCY